MLLSLSQAQSPEQINEVRGLFKEYADSLGFSLCFQDFEQELAGLPGKYAPPSGCLFLGSAENEPAGCVALHSLNEAVCEMKRLYVRPRFRRTGLGRILAGAAISEARKIGYARMRLDTIGSRMREAVGLYRALGFQEIAPYRANPIEGALYMELIL